MRRWIVPAALAAVTGISGGLCVASAAASDTTSGGHLPGPPLVTPVLSPRRVPELLVAVQGDLKLKAGLDAALDDPTLGAARQHSCLVVRQAGATLFDRRGTTPLIPGRPRPSAPR